MTTQICGVDRLPVAQVNNMATYTIVPRTTEDGFDVAVVGNDGARQTILNFRTEADAEAWIVQDERHDRQTAPVAE